MPRVATCPQGHHWEILANGGGSDPKVACPVCGVTVDINRQEPTLDGLELLRSQAARLQQLGSENQTLPPRPPLPGPTQTQAPPVRVGDDYEIVGELGRGGMGVVYKAVQTSLKRLVALKMLLPGGHCGDEERRRFRTEAEAAARLQHPNIVQIYEIGEADGRPYFSMEFVEGGNLASRLAGTPVPSRQAARLVEALARAVHAAHERGIIHRDLKPANILLAGDGTPKITDFGLAKRLGGDSGQTQYGSIMGTPSYMAPEHVGGKGREIGAASDVYSLGAILYEMVAGRPPFRAATPLDTVLQVISEEPLPPSRLQPKVSHDLETICLKCLSKDPRKRYSTTLALAEDLHRYIDHKPILARPVPFWERTYKWARRRPAAAALAVLLTMIALSALYGFIYRIERKRQKLEETVARQDIDAYFKNVRLALFEWQADRADDAAATLAICAKDLRNWEWRYLRRQCAGGKRTLSGGGFSVTLDRQGRRLAAAGAGPLTVWDTATGNSLTLPLPDQDRGRRARAAGPVAAASPDGTIIAAPMRENSIKGWDAASGKELFSLRGHAGAINCLVFSEDGRRLASGGADGTAKIWEIASRRLLANLPGHGGGVAAVAVSADGQKAATSACDGTVRVWDVARARQELVVDERTNDATVPIEAVLEPVESSLRGQTLRVRPVALSGDGKSLVYGSGHVIRRLELPGGKEQLPLSGHREAVRCLAVSGDGRRLVSGGADRVLIVWDLAHGQALYHLRGHTDVITGVALSGDGGVIASTAFDGTVRLWDAADPLARVLASPASVRDVRFGSDRLLAAAGEDGVVRIWDIDAARPIAKLFADAGPAQAIAFSSITKQLAVGYADDSVRIWDASGQLLRKLQGHTKGVTALSFNSDGSRLGSASLDGTVRIWDPSSGQCLRTFTKHAAPVYALTFGPGMRVASAGADMMVHLWSAETGDETFALGGHGSAVTSLAYSRDGQRLASASVDGSVKLWSPREGRELTTYGGHRDAVRALAFTPDGSRLASAGADETIRLWGVPKSNSEPPRREILALAVHGSALLTLDFSPDGDRLVSGGADGAVRVWDASPVPEPANDEP
jgi:WD40 repeat protein/predicted Ser/Thr protein kinase